MGLVALYPKKRTSIPDKAHMVFPYLLRQLKVIGPRRVFAADITYIPMSKGFLYLVAVIDCYSRKVLSHRISNTLDTEFCVEAVEAAMAIHRAPETSIRIREASSRRRNSRTYLTNTTSGSRWTAKGAGGTTCSSSARGEASSMRKSI